MANERAKYLNSRRRQKDENAVKKQLKIARQHNSFPDENKVLKEPHRLTKHHAMDCGNPACFMCGNPRKTHKDKLTAQEKRIFQDAEKTSDRHSNGLPPNGQEDFL
jgi:hypothetical protein